MTRESDREGSRFYWFQAGVFTVATVCKAVEPVLIDLSQAKPGSTEGAGYKYSLSSAIACAEALKCVVCYYSIYTYIY